MGHELRQFNPLIQHKAIMFQYFYYYYYHYYLLELVSYWVNKWNDLRGGVRAGAV